MGVFAPIGGLRRNQLTRETVTDFEDRRETFGARLRGLRERRKISGRQLADQLGWPPAKPSKIETGRQTPTDQDVRDWCQVLDVDDAEQTTLLGERDELEVQQFAWRRELRTGHRAKQADTRERELAAHRITAVDIAAVTGLVQTPDYARRMFLTQADLLDVPADDADAAVRERMQRGQLLYDPSKDVEILIGEAALVNPIAPPTEMRVQLDRLLSVIGLPNVHVGIIPLGARLPHFLPHGYWIIDDEVLVELVTSEIRIDDPEQVAVYRTLTERLWSVAATGDAARELLRRVTGRFDGT